VLSAVAVGWAASIRDRPRYAWTMLGLWLSPLFAVLLLIAAGPMTERERELQERDRQFMEGQRGRER
jgi:cytochrome c-type biogenesis protein CcmH/NrfF